MRDDQRHQPPAHSGNLITVGTYTVAMDGFSIGELAAKVGIATSAIRFYERSGLLKADARTPGNYRHFGKAALERLQLIRSAQSVGLSLDDIRSLLTLTNSGDRCSEVQALLRERLADVQNRMKDLRRIERTLTKALSTCGESDNAGLCAEVGRLTKC